jgi:hypothetical protein
MNRASLVKASFPLLLVACASSQRAAETPAAIAPPAAEHASAPAAAKAAALATTIPALPLRAPGDYVVYRFSGKLKKHPITLTERIVAIDDDEVVTDYTMEEGLSKRTMRVHAVGDGVEQKIVSAALMDGTIEGPVSTATFDAFLARTIVSPESNTGVEGTEKVTLSVGGHPMDCTKTTYKVTLDKAAATMNVLESAEFAWGDVGGEITAKDGSLLYKAELVGMGTAASAETVVAQKTP